MIRLKPLHRIKQETRKPWLLILPTTPQAPQKHTSLYWGCGHPGSSSLSQWGQLDEYSSDADWQALAQLSQQAHTVLLLAANCVSFFQIAAPKGVKPKEWPLLLEEVTPSDPDNLIIGALKNDKSHKDELGTLSLLVTAKDQLEAWQRWAQSLNIRLQYWSSPLHLQPVPDTPETLSVTGDHEHWLIKSQTQWLCWPRALEAQIPPQWHDRSWATHWDIQQSTIPQWLTLMIQQLPGDCPRIPPLRQRGITRLHDWRQTLGLSHSLSDTGRLRFKRSLLAITCLALGHWGLTYAQQWQIDHANAKQQAQALDERDIPQHQAIRAIHQRLEALNAQQQRQHKIKTILAETRAQLPEAWPPLAQLSVNADHIILTWPQASAISPEMRATMDNLGTLSITPTALTLRRSLKTDASLSTTSTPDRETERTTQGAAR